MEKNEEKNAIAAINEALTEAGCEYRLCAECGKIIKEGLLLLQRRVLLFGRMRGEARGGLCRRFLQRERRR